MPSAGVGTVTGGISTGRYPIPRNPILSWLVDLTWNSSRLEGNTYSLLETWQFLHTGQPAEGKDAGATQMLLNHKAAIDLLVSIDLVNAPDGMVFNHSTVCKLQTLLSENLLPDSSTSWRFRVPDGTFHSLLHKANAIADPFEQAYVRPDTCAPPATL